MCACDVRVTCDLCVFVCVRVCVGGGGLCMHVCAHSARTYLCTLGAGERVQKHESARHERHVAPPHSGCPCRICSSTRGGPARTAPGLGSLLPHLRQDWARPATSAPKLHPPLPHLYLTAPHHNCTGTGRTCARQHRECAHLHQDCFHHCHICAWTGWTTARLRARARSEPTRRRASRACSAAAAPLRNAARKGTAEHRASCAVPT